MDELITVKEAQNDKMIHDMDLKIHEMEQQKVTMIQEFQQQMSMAEKRFQKEIERLEKQSRQMIHL